MMIGVDNIAIVRIARNDIRIDSAEINCSPKRTVIAIRSCVRYLLTIDLQFLFGQVLITKVTIRQ